MTFWKQKYDEWLTHRLNDVSVTHLLATQAAPETSSIYNRVAPERGDGQRIAYPILVFYEAGIVVDTCLGELDPGATAQYITGAWLEDAALDALAPILEAVEGRLTDSTGNGVSEVYNGVQFTVIGKLNEASALPTEAGGVLAANGTIRWYLAATPAA